MTEYKLLSVPQGFTTTPCRDWNSKHVTAYFDWLMKIRFERVKDFCFFFFDSEFIPKDLDFSRTALTVLDKVKENSLLENRKIVPNSLGLSLCFDFGLFLAEYCIKYQDELKWGIVKGPKSDINYNLPAIFRLKEKNYIFEPIGLVTRRMRFNLNNEDPNFTTFWPELIESILMK